MSSTAAPENLHDPHNREIGHRVNELENLWLSEQTRPWDQPLVVLVVMVMVMVVLVAVVGWLAGWLVG